MPIPRFKEFLAFMDKKQGSMLREFSQAARPIIDGIFEGSIREDQQIDYAVRDPNVQIKPRGYGLSSGSWFPENLVSEFCRQAWQEPSYEKHSAAWLMVDCAASVKLL